MTGAQIITKFREMVDDQLEEDFEYQLLNDAKDEVEAETTWEQLKKETSYSVSSGYSYTSALGTLPTRFALPVRMTEDSAYTEYDAVSFDDRYAKANHPYGYFIDLAGGNIHLTGENHNAKTMYFYYTDYSADLTSSDTWVFPARFHSIIPLKMAELYYAADAGEKSRAWDDRWSAQYERKLAQMLEWNDQIKTRNRGPRRRYAFQNPKGVNF